MTLISGITSGLSVNNVNNAQNLQKTDTAKDVVIKFPKSEQAETQKEPEKWLRPGSFDINMFSRSSAYVDGEKRIVYSDENGNKYVSVSGADLVLLDKTESGNLFRKARYTTSLSKNEYENLTKDTAYRFDYDDYSKQGVDKETEKARYYRKALEKFGVESHGSNGGVGTVTVNGEKMLFFETKSENGKKGITLMRETGHGKEFLEFNNVKELKSALKSKDNNFGAYSGVKDMYEYFIPQE